ncbi:MAG: sulfur relay protein TusB/DsrH [Gammaproteobacteria bacterium]|jgi:sulfur relay protein TusB/DsrH
MLIVFLGTEYQSIDALLPQITVERPHAIIIAQQGIYQLDNVLREMQGRHDIAIYVLQRDLLATGLLLRAQNYEKVNVIDFTEFVTLTTQHGPCITLQ